MSSTERTTEGGSASTAPAPGEFRLEVVALPVSDVDRAKAFYAGLGWREDADFDVSEDFRVVQFTPPGSGCSIAFGKGVITADPGSIQRLEAAVYDIEATREDLISRGVEVSEIWHTEPGTGKVPGIDPQRQGVRILVASSDEAQARRLLAAAGTAGGG